MKHYFQICERIRHWDTCSNCAHVLQETVQWWVCGLWSQLAPLQTENWSIKKVKDDAMKCIMIQWQKKKLWENKLISYIPPSLTHSQVTNEPCSEMIDSIKSNLVFSVCLSLSLIHVILSFQIWQVGHIFPFPCHVNRRPHAASDTYTNTTLKTDFVEVHTVYQKYKTRHIWVTW